MKNLCYILWPYFLVIIFARRENLDKQAQTFVQLGSVISSLTIMTLLGKMRLYLVDYCVLVVLITRIVITFLLFEFIQD